MRDLNETALGPDAIRLDGKVALVTGGAGGIGRGIAMGLAAFGADVAILDIDGAAAETVAGLIRDKGRRALPIVADVTDRDALFAGFDKVGQELGGLDILVNNAGGTRYLPILDVTPRQLDKQLDYNFKSLVNATQAAAKMMIAGGRGGAIVNLASIEAMRASPGFSVYAAAKAGIANFTRSVALELSEYGIRVNAIAPDLVPTEILIRHVPMIMSEEWQEAQKAYIPLGRTGTLDDCAGAAVFLASSMSSYITGITINIDGGTYASSGWTRHAEGGRWKLFDEVRDQSVADAAHTSKTKLF